MAPALTGALPFLASWRSTVFDASPSKNGEEAIVTQQQQVPAAIDVDVSTLRDAIRVEYAAVAKNPDGGFHFHTVVR